MHHAILRLSLWAIELNKDIALNFVLVQKTELNIQPRQQRDIHQKSIHEWNYESGGFSETQEIFYFLKSSAYLHF